MDVRSAGLQLRDALKRRDIAEVRAILRVEPRAADWQDEDGLAALHVAGRPELIQALLDAGADINIVDRRGFTPLYLIQIAGGREASQALLARGARVDTADADGCTALHSAAAFLREDAVELLLTNGADPAARNKRGYTPAHYALEDGNERNARFLWERTGIRDVFLAAGLGEVEYLSRVLDEDPCLSQAVDGWLLTPLHWAAGHGQLESTRLLLRHSPNVNVRDELGRTPLHSAAVGSPIRESPALGARSFEVAKLLVEHGADVSARSNDGLTPLALLRRAPHANKPALEKLLVELNAT
jgi:ankyrin repeat protein